MVKVKVSKGLTINMGNYESLRLDVGVEIDAASSNKREIENVYERASEFVRDKLQEEVDAWDLKKDIEVK